MEWALEIVMEWLMQQMGVEKKFVGLQLSGFPPYTAPEWYVGIDDRGSDNTTDHTKFFVTERFRFQICCWVRISAVARDRHGTVLGATDLYRPVRDTLGSVERQVLNAMLPFEKQTALMTQINAVAATDPNRYGDCLIFPAYYAGRSPKEEYVPPWAIENPNVIAFLGRRLNFTFPERVQTWESFE